MIHIALLIEIGIYYANMKRKRWKPVENALISLIAH